MSDVIEGILQERGKAYGDYTTGARLMQDVKALFRAHPCWGILSAVHRQTIEATCDKMVRSVNGNSKHKDNPTDIMGYNLLWLREIEKIEALEKNRI